jgi:LPXTG-motif cell wall-anchored protein
MNVANIAIADWLGRRLRAPANLRVTRGLLPNTGEKGPTIPTPNDVWLPLAGLSILTATIGYTIYRRRRSAA